MHLAEGAREARHHDGEDGAGVGVGTGDGGREGALERDHEGDERRCHEGGVEAAGEEGLESGPAEDEDGIADGIAECDERRDAAGGHIRGEPEQASHEWRPMIRDARAGPRGMAGTAVTRPGMYAIYALAGLERCRHLHGRRYDMTRDVVAARP